MCIRDRPLDKLLDRNSSGVVRDNETTVTGQRAAAGADPDLPAQDPRQRGER